MEKYQKRTFAGNSSIDEEIYDLLPLFDQQSQNRMKSAIRNAYKAAKKYGDENSDANARHVFREFLPAAELNRNGFHFEYERVIQGKKPDWFDETSKILLESYTFERNGISDFWVRLASVIKEKCEKYGGIAVRNSLYLIVAVYLDFVTCKDRDDIQEEPEKLNEIFTINQQISGVIFFTETLFVGTRQIYHYFCVSRDSSLSTIPKWPFEILKII